MDLALLRGDHMAIWNRFGSRLNRATLMRSNDFAQQVPFADLESRRDRSGAQAGLVDSAPALVPMSLANASSIAVRAMKSGALSKLDTQLASLYYSHSSQAVGMSAFTSSVSQFANSITADGKYVLVDATAKNGNGAALLSQLKALGVQGGSSYGAVASGWVPTSSIAALAATSDLAFARESAFTASTGAVTTQADHAEAADTARSTYGVTGAGLRVGVISDSFNADYGRGGSDTMYTDIASGDLPTDTTILQDYNNGEDEGRGMAQLVHDIAPGASIDFASGDYGQAGFANNIVALANAGDKVIVDDLLYIDEPSYQNGVIAQAVNKVAAQGVSYFAAADNNGAQGYEGSWVAGAATTLNGNTYTVMNFAPGQDYLTVTDPADSYINLQWDSPAASAGGAGSPNDLDLYLVDSTGAVVASGTSNNIGGDPSETLYTGGLAAGTYKLYVGLASGAAPGDIRVVAIGNGRDIALGSVASNTNNGTMYGHTAADGTIAVGAASFADTPAAGVNPPVSEYYSSRGVDHVLFADDGTRLAAPHDGRVALTGVDGGNTTFFGYDSADDADTLPNFYGTSAAAPDVAAVAALMLEARSTLTPGDVRNLLQDSAIPMADVLTSGSGLIQADKAVGFAETLTIANGQQTTLKGTHLGDTINGGSGADILDGQGGADTMSGGAGNDTYYVDNSADKVIESSTGGADTVYASASFSLTGQYIETLTLTGSANINATGNSQVNTLNGNAGNNVLNGGAGADTMAGGAGDDTYYVDNSADKVIEAGSGGTDTVYATASFSLAGQYVEKLALTGTGNINATGNSQANTLVGNSGNNVLDGKAGADVMSGGTGDDTYYVDNVGDNVVETSANGGNDKIFSSVSYSLSGRNIETLTLTGTADTNATGNNSANILVGDSGANILDGKSGSDTLTGGAGKDDFLFDTSLGTGNVDTITDFSLGNDLIELDRSIFKAITADGALASGAFYSGTAAHDADDRIIYNSATGDIFYDADGNGAGKQVAFAHVTAGLALSASSFSGVNTLG